MPLYNIFDFIISSVQLMYSDLTIQSTLRVRRIWTEFTFSKEWRIYINHPRVSLYTSNENRVHELNKDFDFRDNQFRKGPTLVLTNAHWITPHSFVYVACHGYFLHMFPPSWHLSLAVRKIMHFCLQITWTGFKSKQLILFLVGYMISSFIRTAIFTSLRRLQYFHSEIFSYRIQLQPFKHCFLAKDVMQIT